MCIEIQVSFQDPVQLSLRKKEVILAESKGSEAFHGFKHVVYCSVMCGGVHLLSAHGQGRTTLQIDTPSSEFLNDPFIYLTSLYHETERMAKEDAAIDR